MFKGLLWGTEGFLDECGVDEVPSGCVFSDKGQCLSTMEHGKALLWVRLREVTNPLLQI